MSYYETLQDMIDILPDTISNLDTGIDNLQDSIDGLTAEQNAIEWTFTLMSTASSAWMDDKANDLDPTYTVITSGGWSVSNLTEWAITDPAANPDQSVIYSDTDVVSAAPPSGAETKQYNRQIGFASAYDHIHKDPGTDGTYGIAPKKTSLTTGKSLQTTNRDKYKEVLKVYERVLREK